MRRLKVVQFLLQPRDLGFRRGVFGREALVDGLHWHSDEPISLIDIRQKRLFHLNSNPSRAIKATTTKRISLHLPHALVNLGLLRQRPNLL